jgi:hypothetical protein
VSETLYCPARERKVISLLPSEIGEETDNADDVVIVDMET